LTAEGDHLGGLILPGLAQFSNQLIQKASLLSLEKTTKTTLLANNTADALASGRVYGLVEAINGISSRMEVELLKMNDLRGKPKIMYPVKIILCGGDAKVLHPYLNQSTQREDDWLMQGLELIAKFSSSGSYPKPSVVE
jgi:type III pantothenate kinase